MYQSKIKNHTKIYEEYDKRNWVVFRVDGKNMNYWLEI